MQKPSIHLVASRPEAISHDIPCDINPEVICVHRAQAVRQPGRLGNTTPGQTRDTAPARTDTRNFLQHCLAQTAWLCGALCVMLLLFTNIASAELNPATDPNAATNTITPLTALDNDSTFQEWTADPVNTAGTGELYAIENGVYRSVPLLQTSAVVEIAGIVSHVVLKQKFHNLGDHTIEAVYVFPLPEDAAIRELNVRVGQRTIQGMIRERESAEQLYQAASNNGRVAAIVKQQRPNLFTLNIANVGAGEKIEVELNYIQTLSVSDNRYSMRLPLTLTPRYSNNQVTDAAAITPQHITGNQPGSHTFQLQALIKTPQELSLIGSDSHSLQYSKSDSGYRVSLAGTAVMDRDLELHWEVTAGNTPDITIFTETVADEKFMLGLVKSPSLKGSEENPWARPLARELVMVIDTSGSMAGQPMDTAIEALFSALQGLNEQDYFNIIAFSDRTRSLFHKSRPANNNTLTTAADFIHGLRAEGGTEMMPALRAALRQSGSAPLELIRQIVFITDGAVGYEQTIFAELDRKIGNSRLFTVGIGHAPNAYFMTQAAARGRGTYTFIADAVQVSSAMTDLFNKLENPVMKDLTVSWIGEPGELAVPALRDLHAGEPLVFSAKLKASTRGFKLAGLLGNQRWEQQVMLQPAAHSTQGQPPETVDAKAISTLWARKKIAALQEKIDRQGNRPDKRATINAQNRAGLPLPEAAHKHLDIRSQIVELALAHKLVTPFTSLVAIDELVSQNTLEPQVQAAVPNLAPAGTQMIRINLPQGATGIDRLWLLSATCFTLALLLGGLIFRFEYLSFGDPA